MLVWLLALGLAAAPPQPLGPPDPVPPPIKQAMDLYRAADLWGALDLLSTYPVARLQQAEEALAWRDDRGLVPVQWPRMRTAVALMTEAWFRGTEHGPSFRSDPYLLSARRIARRALRMVADGHEGFGPEAQRFIRDWYLLIVAYRHGHGQVAWSRAFLAEARQLFPKDARVLLVSGADHEMLSDVIKGSLYRVDATGQITGQSDIDPARELDRAVEFFRQAAAMAPELVEARLRLGRTLYRRNDLPGATRELQAALELAVHEPVRYLALAFLGMVETARGDFQAADRLYGDAQRLFPSAQSISVIRSEAAYLSGRSADAASLVAARLREPAREDPWWMYSLGEWWHFEARMRAMRAEVRR